MQEKPDVAWLRIAIRAAEVLNRPVAAIPANIGEKAPRAPAAETNAARADAAEREAGTVQPTPPLSAPSR